MVEEHYEVNTLNFAHSAVALALSHQAQGRPEKARKMIKAIVNRAVGSKSSELLQFAEAFQAELALRQGHVAEAKKVDRKLRTPSFSSRLSFLCITVDMR